MSGAAGILVGCCCGSGQVGCPVDCSSGPTTITVRFAGISYHRESDGAPVAGLGFDADLARAGDNCGWVWSPTDYGYNFAGTYGVGETPVTGVAHTFGFGPDGIVCGDPNPPSGDPSQWITGRNQTSGFPAWQITPGGPLPSVAFSIYFNWTRGDAQITDVRPPTGSMTLELAATSPATGIVIDSPGTMEIIA